MVIFDSIEERCEAVANFVIENKATVREAGKRFGISKSTVHKDITEKLSKINPALYAQVCSVLELNRLERHIRGGLATKRKFEQIKSTR